PDVPDQLVQEGRMEGGELFVTGRSVGRVDRQRPRQVGGAAEELLVEPVAEPPDPLRQDDSGRECVSERPEPHSTAPTHQPHAEATEWDRTPDPEATVPDG